MLSMRNAKDTPKFPNLYSAIELVARQPHSGWKREIPCPSSVQVTFPDLCPWRTSGLETTSAEKDVCKGNPGTPAVGWKVEIVQRGFPSANYFLTRKLWRRFASTQRVAPCSATPGGAATSRNENFFSIPSNGFPSTST